MNLSFVSFGCHNLTAGSSRQRSMRLVSCALDLGITRFDVAPSYGMGTAERMLGDALGPHRNDSRLEITSKFGRTPERYGTFKSWLREPYRWARQWNSGGRELGHVVKPVVIAASNPIDAVDLIGPRKAAERSLSALRVERLGTFLTHEAVASIRRAPVLEELAMLQRHGLAVRTGFSGEIESVLAMVLANGGSAEVAQVSILDLRTLPMVGERRGFNLSHLAQRLLDNESLRRSLANELGRACFGTALSASLTWAHTEFPKGVFLVNASTPARLTSLLTPVLEDKLVGWANVNTSAMLAIATRGNAV